MTSEQESGASSVLTAHYNSPSGAQTFEQPLPRPATTTPKDKTAYLNTLRSSTKRLQEQINNFLTAKMEEDKQHGTTKSTREQEEEANYGEEKVEED